VKKTIAAKTASTPRESKDYLRGVKSKESVPVFLSILCDLGDSPLIMVFLVTMDFKKQE